MNRRRAAWILILIVDAGYIARGGTILFRLYGVYCPVFGVMAGGIAVAAFRRGDRSAWCHRAV